PGRRVGPSPQTVEGSPGQAGGPDPAAGPAPQENQTGRTACRSLPTKGRAQTAGPRAGEITKRSPGNAPRDEPVALGPGQTSPERGQRAHGGNQPADGPK